MARTGTRLLGALAALALAAAPVVVASPAQAAPLLAPGLDIVPLATGLKDPTMLDVAPDGRVFIAERTGRVKIWHQDGRLTEAGRVGVDSKLGQCNDCEGTSLDEGGLHGLLLAEDFAQTGHVYLYRSLPKSLGRTPMTPKHAGARGPQSTEGLFRLSRYTITGGRLDLASEVPLMENPAEWASCCHYGGDLEWLADGTLVLSTGDDTISSQSGGYSPHDQRLGKEFNSAMLTSQNPADRRGKILRLRPDGTVPDGSRPGEKPNPFVGQATFDPYVYAMGFRSNYRFAVDPKSQSLLVGNVGPDGLYPDPNRGPQAHEELEVVPPGGGTNHGWPKCIANNIAYNQYDWETNTAGPKFDCSQMTPAAFYYTYYPWPVTNTNVTATPGIGNAIEGGVAYRKGTKGALALPELYQDRLFFMDWSRGGIQTLPLTADGGLDTLLPSNLALIERDLKNPIDMGIGPDGAIYFIEYGGSLYNGSSGRLQRIQCAGCTASPADYPGLTTALVDPTDAAAPALTAPGRSLPLYAVPVALGGLVLTAAAGLRRRRAVV